MGRAGTRAGDADRIDLAALPLMLGLNPDLVFPQIAEIILLEDPLAHAQLEIDECHLATRRVAVAFAGPSPTIVPAVQLESMQMTVLPAEGDLDCSVQRVECHFFRNEQPARYHRRDSSQAHFELIHLGICNTGHGAQANAEPTRPPTFSCSLLPPSPRLSICERPV